jgi:hypothetical protein
MMRVLRCIFPKIVTSRSESKNADDRGVDLVNTSGWAFQCKRYGRRYPNFEEVIENMDTKDKKVVISKRDRKPILVTMELSTFMKILNESS